MDQYPEDIAGILGKEKIEVIEIDGMDHANRIGNPLVVSTLLLGVLSHFLDFPEKTWISVITELVPEKHRDLNLKAFQEGKALLKV